ncbi:hypothetical protein [Aquabacterium humicola]|uniref:hypothetical protein n=1 Tax=Aquabacterium humicola TaxID=3237377 RepID=UPI0025431BFE|nr:hypothetical protein [Rubrivivax pictus]
MLIKHHVEYVFPIKGKLHVPDVIGLAASHRLKPGAILQCTFESPTGEQYEVQGKVAFEFVNYKGRVDNPDRIGGSLIFAERPGGHVPQGWTLFVLLEE